jgi:hypothetical protein
MVPALIFSFPFFFAVFIVCIVSLQVL